MFKLVIADDEGKTTVVPLVREEITIGRKEGNTIRLTERNVSRRHARLQKANGAFLVEDLQSYNGVKVNGRRIDGKSELKAGDQIGIGDYLLALQVDGADVADAPTAAVPGPATADAATAMISAPEEPVPPARLVMLSPPAPGAEFALSKDRIRIGRAEDLDAWVNHRSISREHAEVIQEGDQFRIVDLGSANGMRVNGQELTTAPLSSGDVIELGQVKFRFVGEGEAYVFDADATIQMEAVTLGEGRSKAPILAAVGIIGVAVVIGLVIALSGADEDEGVIVEVVPTPSEAPTDRPVQGDDEAESEELAEALDGCWAALESGDVDTAISRANDALAINAGSAGARSCLRNAEGYAEQQAIFDRAVGFLRGDHPEDAYFAKAELDDDSPFTDRDEIAEIDRAYAAHHLDAGRQSLAADDWAQVRAHVDAISTIEGATDAQRRAAEQLQQRAVREARREAALASAQNPREPRPPQPDRADPPPDRPDPPPQQRRTCEPTAPDYSRCIIQTLEGRASSQNELAQLIEAYRATGNQPAALRHMQTFVRRFGQTSRGRQYCQILMRNGRDCGL